MSLAPGPCVNTKLLISAHLTRKLLKLLVRSVRRKRHMARSTIPQTFALVNQFHQELAAERNLQGKITIIQRYASNLRLRGEELSADADAIQNVAVLYVDNNTILKILGCITNNVPETTTERRRERAIKILIACWSWQRVEHYQWERLPYKTLIVFAGVARKYPVWDDFVALANHQLLNRHERSLKDQKIPRIGQHHTASVIQTPLSPLERGDIIAIMKMCDTACDVQSRGHRWLVPCLCMSELFAGDKNRMALFVVRFDDHDMLVPSQGSPSQQTQTCSNCEVQRPRISGLCLPRRPSSGSISRVSDMSRGDDSISDTTRSYSESHSHASTMPLDDHSQCENSSAHETIPSDHCSAPVSVVSIDGCTLADESGDAQTDQSSEHSAHELTGGHYDEDVWGTPVISYALSTTASKRVVHEETALHLPILAPVDRDASGCRIEHLIQIKYSDLLQSYYNRMQAEAEKGPLYRLRSEWFAADTEHARVWCPPECGLGVGSALSEEDADVWHYTTDVFLDHARQQKSFIRPVLIKGDATSSDLPHHSLKEFMEFLQSAYDQKTLDVQSLEHTAAEAMPFAKFRSTFDERIGSNALNLRNLTRSHRPPFTMLPRFRLLDVLVERAEVDSRKKTVSSPNDISSCAAGFNILGAANAFSGAHQDYLGHTWVRNLDGLKFWMTVHPNDMQSSWNEFYRYGSYWSPRGKAKLTVVEKGDVLVMMPDEFDRATVHSVHSPEASLMEGAMFFDDARILPTLNCILEIGQHQNSTNEAIAYQLPRILRELDCLVRTGRGMLANHAFQADCANVLRKLEGLGCKCSALAEQHVCVCRKEGRRCTAWCSDHPDLPTLECMEEGSASNLQKGGCHTGRSPSRKRKHT